MTIRTRHLAMIACFCASSVASCRKADPPGTPAGQVIIVHAGKPISSEDRMVLFAFDDYSIPSTRGLKIQMLQPEKYSGNPIISRGLAGEPDEDRAQGVSVVREEGRWRLWYQAQAGETTHAAYAESEDGVSWRKPQLGLTEFNGSRSNNLLRTEAGVEVRSVLLNPEGPAEHRYVMAAADRSWWQDWKMDVPSMTRVEVSSDGLEWKSLRDQPGIVAQQNKIMTLYRFNDYFHLGGYQIYPLVSLPLQLPDLGKDFWAPRTFSVWRSPDLERWPLENTKAFYKPMRSSSPYRQGWDREEVHVGAMVTTYPNVCLGVYGQWHHPIDEGAPQYRGEDVSVDLGLIISNDGLHFRDPAPGFTFLRRDQELTWDRDFKNNKDQDNFLVHPVNGEVPPVKGRSWKLPHYANRGKTSSSGGELASARSCFSTVRTALGKLRITGLLARFDVARSFPQFPRPLLLQPTIWTSERGADLGSGRCQPRPHLPIYRMTQFSLVAGLDGQRAREDPHLLLRDHARG